MTRPYWESVKAHAMRIQRCDTCRSYVFYPRALCPYCGGGRLAWTPVTGRATLHSFTIVHRAPLPELQSETPYVVALGELVEGVRLVARLLDVAPDPAGLQIGARLTLDYADASDEITLPVFRPA